MNDRYEEFYSGLLKCQDYDSGVDYIIKHTDFIDKNFLQTFLQKFTDKLLFTDRGEAQKLTMGARWFCFMNSYYALKNFNESKMEKDIHIMFSVESFARLSLDDCHKIFGDLAHCLDNKFLVLLLYFAIGIAEKQSYRLAENLANISLLAEEYKVFSSTDTAYRRMMQGMIFYDCGKMEFSEKMLKEAVSLMEKNDNKDINSSIFAIINLYLGRIYEKTGHSDKALEYFKLASSHLNKESFDQTIASEIDSKIKKHLQKRTTSQDLNDENALYFQLFEKLLTKSKDILENTKILEYNIDVSKNLSVNDYEQALDLAQKNREIFNVHESLKAVHHALDIAKKIEHQETTKAHFLLGTILGEQGNFNASQKELEIALQKAELLPEKERKTMLSSIYGQLGIVCRYLGELQKAKQYLSKSFEIDYELDNKDSLLSNYNNLGSIYMLEMDTESAKDAYSEAQRLAKELKDLKGQASSLANLANIEMLQGHLEKSISMVEEAKNLYTQIGDLHGAVVCLYQAGISYLFSGNIEKGSLYLYEAEKIATEMNFGDILQKLSMLKNMGQLLKSMKI